MTRYAHLDPSSFFLPGGPTGVLLLHGYTGSPPEMRLIGDYLNARGLTVSAPLLPGHGTNLADMSTRHWTEWTRAAEGALAGLKSRCATVFAGGLSMGSLLALYLAIQHRDLAGAFAYSPAVMVRDWRICLTPVARFFVPPQAKGPSDLHEPGAERRLWSYEADPPAGANEVFKLMRWVRRRLPKVRCPLLVAYSTDDHVIHPQAGPFAFQHTGSCDKELLVLHQSGHCITVDGEWETVAKMTYRFIQQHTTPHTLS